MPEFIIVEGPRDGAAIITLNRPDKKNALSIALRDEISDALQALAADDALKCVIITGAGDAFCAGFDLKEFERVREPGFGEKLWTSSDRYHRACLEFPLPMIAAVNGAALAGGFDLAVMCDLRVASGTARFGHPEVTFGDVVYGPLHDLVGGAVARDLCLTGRIIGVEEALAMRIVSRVVPPDELMDAARQTAAQIARAPRDMLVRTKAKATRRAATVSDRTLDL
jgi:enoyl-CoA hydratase